MTKINKYTLGERHRVATTVIKHLDDPLNYTPQEFVEAAEKAIKEYPNEWIVFYIAADYYAQLGRYLDALRALERCVQLKPDEIRSAYALATTYNLFTRAEWVGNPEVEAYFAWIGRTTGDVTDLAVAKSELAKSGLLIEMAALQAIRWFEKALTLKPDGTSRAIIKQDLQTLYNRFPQLNPIATRDENGKSKQPILISSLIALGIAIVVGLFTLSFNIGLAADYPERGYTLDQSFSNAVLVSGCYFAGSFVSLAVILGAPAIVRKRAWEVARWVFLGIGLFSLLASTVAGGISILSALIGASYNSLLCGGLVMTLIVVVITLKRRKSKQK